jgi:haloacetate dehalogenase
MFDGFETVEVDVGSTTIFARRKGNGRPLLLLHGFPETHVMWHRVAPALARQFTVICADLRGYGASGKPASTPDHAPYAKSAMAIDMMRLMDVLGFSSFSVAGHDRGARVAYRLALDHPAASSASRFSTSSQPAKPSAAPIFASRWLSGRGRCSRNPSRCPNG